MNFNTDNKRFEPAPCDKNTIQPNGAKVVGVWLEEDEIVKWGVKAIDGEDVLVSYKIVKKAGHNRNE